MNHLILMLALTTLTAANSQAAVKRIWTDVHPPTQQMVEKQTVTAPAVNGTTQVLSANAGPTSAAAATVTTFAAQPDVPRNLVITPGGTTGDVESCVITVTGTNFFSSTITETFTFAADASSAQTGSKAFKTVSSVAWPANCESGGFAATWSIGYGAKLGLKRCMTSAVHFLAAGLAGVREGTFPTVAAHATNIESNTATLSTSLNGTDVQLFFMQNFGCFP